MKRVSFNVAKAIKEAGFPQDGTNSHYTNYGELVYYGIVGETGFDVPTYLEVWLWLWREKNINMKDTRDGAIWIWVGDNPSIYLQVSRDPEEVIIAAIEY